MKINLLVYHLDLGGVEKTVVDLANQLVDLDHDVTITTIYKFKPEKFVIDERVNLVKNLGFYFKGLNSLIMKVPAKLLYKIFVKDKYDLEIAFQAELPTDIIANSSNRDSIKYAWIHGVGVKKFDNYEIFDKIIFVSEDVKNFYSDKLNLKCGDKLKVVYNAMDFVEISEKSKIQEDEIDNEKITFISVGRLSQEKNFDRLIDAFYTVDMNTDVDCELIIVGSGVLYDTLHKKIVSLNMQEKIKLLGFQKNPYKYMANSDVYVCSSDYEGFNVAVTEAGFLDLPIVTTAVFGSRELLGENQYGVVVDISTEALAHGMAQMLDVEMRNKYKKIIKNRVTQLFIDTRDKQVEDLFLDNIEESKTNI